MSRVQVDPNPLPPTGGGQQVPINAKTVLSGPASTPTPPSGTGIDGPNSYTAIIVNMLTQWGLTSLISDVEALGRDSSNTSDMIYLKLQQTDAWKQRFAGNAERIKNGLGALDPATYIALEGQYKQALRQYGLPDGFYDDKTTTDGWIGGDVSASEVAGRAQEAATLIYNSPKSAMDEWNKYYGGSGAGGAIATILDSTKAAPLVANMVTSAQIGGVARDQGLNVDQSRAMQFAQNGVTIDSARKAYSDIASRLGTDQAASARFGQQFGQTQEENATLLGQGQAINQQANLYAMEKGQFSGHGGGSDASNDSGANY